MKAACVALIAGMVGCTFVQPVLAAEGAKTWKEKALYSFHGRLDGALPYAGVIDVNGTLYGTTYEGGGNSCTGGVECGTVFSVDPATGAETVLHAFGSGTDGKSPDAGLIDVRGTLYGTTIFGGTYGYGAVFSINPKTGAEKVLYSFCSQRNCTDGRAPGSTLIDVKGILYGTTAAGGASGGGGTVFSITTAGAENVLHSFGGSDGAAPEASLVYVKGTLYGTTWEGGASGHGTAFALDLATGEETVAYSFCSQQNCTDGAQPQAGLIDIKGTLYGTTSRGGANYESCDDSGCGTLFSLDPDTGAETVLYSFCSQQNCADGATPEANLIDIKGALYGTTFSGGTSGGGKDGTAFTLDPATGAETVLHSFAGGKDGESPLAGMIDVKGALYGTTADGIASAGTVFVLRK